MHNLLSPSRLAVDVVNSLLTFVLSVTKTILDPPSDPYLEHVFPQSTYRTISKGGFKCTSQSFNIVTCDLYLAYFVIYCVPRINDYQESFHQIFTIFH